MHANTFTVVMTSPNYGPFDNVTGYRSEKVAFCSTLATAYAYCEREYIEGGIDYDGADSPWFSIVTPGGKHLMLWDLHTATMTYYTGPVETDDIPF